METLKTRMEATKSKLEQAQAAPQNQQAAILNGMTGENLTGDMLTATIWGYFANVQNHGVITESQAQVYDRPALSYGLFHAVAQPNKTYGILTTGVSFKGLNMDIGQDGTKPTTRTNGLPTTNKEANTPAPWNMPPRNNSGWIKSNAATQTRTAKCKTPV